MYIYQLTLTYSTIGKVSDILDLIFIECEMFEPFAGISILRKSIANKFQYGISGITIIL